MNLKDRFNLVKSRVLDYKVTLTHYKTVANQFVEHTKKFKAADFPAPLNPVLLKTDPALNALVQELCRAGKLTTMEYISVDTCSPTPSVLKKVAQHLRGEVIELAPIEKRAFLEEQQAVTHIKYDSLNKNTEQPKRKLKPITAKQIDYYTQLADSRYHRSDMVDDLVLTRVQWEDAVRLEAQMRDTLIAKSLVRFFEKLQK